MFKASPPDNPNQDTHRLDRYVDPTGEFTNRDLRFAEWFVKHKILLRQILVGFLFTISLVFGGFSLYKIIEYTFYGYRLGEAQRANLTRVGVALKNVKTETSAKPLAIESAAQFVSSPGKYDFLAMVENPNDRWVAHVYYNFAWATGESEVTDFWLWPQTKNPLTVIGYAGEAVPEARLTIKKIDWYRLDNHTYPDPNQFLTDRLDMSVEDVTFSPANPTLGLSISQTKFTLRNNTAFGYWQAPLVAVLKKGDITVGVKKFVIDELQPESANPVELTSLVETLDLDTVQVYPNLDLLNSEIYLPFKK